MSDMREITPAVAADVLAIGARDLEGSEVRTAIVEKALREIPGANPDSVRAGIDGAVWYLRSVASDLWISENGG